MFDSLFSLYWAMSPSAWAQFDAIVQQIITAGPVDDAEDDGLPIKKFNNVAVLPIKGVMVRSAPTYMQRYGIASAQHIVAALQSAEADADIDKIVFLIDSPGGSTAAMIAIGDAIDATTKEMVTQVDGNAMSAALYVASKTSAIYANRMDLIGSIGVRMVLRDTSALFENEGVRTVLIDTGEHKSPGEPGTVITEEQEAELRVIVDGLYEDFIQAIVNGRNIADAQARELGDGRVFLSPDAVGHGLIDGIQSFETTMSQFIRATPPNRRVSMNASRLKMLEMTS